MATDTLPRPARVLVASWNVNGWKCSPSLPEDPLRPWLYRDQPPDIVAVGFQELETKIWEARVDKDEDMMVENTWVKSIRRALNEGNKYTLVHKERMGWICLLVFVHFDFFKYVERTESASLSCGVGNTLGNKGGVGVRLTLSGGYNLCLVNCHLTAHDENVMRRNEDYARITSELVFPHTRTTVNKCPNVIFFGDLNYRVECDGETVRQALTSNHHLNLIQYDQLNREKSSGRVLSNFQEMKITFRPTYKFDTGTDNYDSSEKNRTPSWTDRILYRGQALVQQSYASHPTLRYSDHKPISALFLVGKGSGAVNVSNPAPLQGQQRQQPPPVASLITFDEPQQQDRTGPSDVFDPLAGMTSNQPYQRSRSPSPRLDGARDSAQQIANISAAAATRALRRQQLGGGDIITFITPPPNPGNLQIGGSAGNMNMGHPGNMGNFGNLGNMGSSGNIGNMGNMGTMQNIGISAPRLSVEGLGAAAPVGRAHSGGSTNPINSSQSYASMSLLDSPAEVPPIKKSASAQDIMNLYHQPVANQMWAGQHMRPMNTQQHGGAFSMGGLQSALPNQYTNMPYMAGSSPNMAYRPSSPSNQQHPQPGNQMGQQQWTNQSNQSQKNR